MTDAKIRQAERAGDAERAQAERVRAGLEVAPEVRALLGSIAKAGVQFVGADWTHELPGEDRHCDGSEECSVCREAEEAADEAREWGDRARYAIEQRTDLRLAVQHLGRAAHLERQWGDDPSWGPVLRAAESLMDQREGR